ncbi:uncharacterized protein FIBRA_02360 [Fibroporia radiculosa]|uniref:Kinesin-like protein n=1 Tax=Fibroporia radiculosa TaxID=599839 RepID=J4GMT7_9APHY|nr:uncharacterized protein FIBRA_02360 [Fibroporia radiculosa]CCM00330.1 predicted protein [Fibroporia radiculosa]
MSSKPKAAPTRASARTKSVTSTIPPATRTTRATATSRANGDAPSTASQPVARKLSSRKPLLNRANSPEVRDMAAGGMTMTATKAKANTLDISTETDREPIKAFLRIRPHLGDCEPSSEPYLDPTSDTTVRMTDPYTSNHSRLSSVNPSSMYKFSHVFRPNTRQSEFFEKTTLPLVKDLLDGQSGLLFTYGVTNSGKTYTIQGGSEKGNAGILPRTLDVIFNSVEGQHGDGRYRPVRLNGVELADHLSQPHSQTLRQSSTAPALADVLEDMKDVDIDIDPTVLKLDRNHEYTVWLSYTEVYNEKVYDLFASVDSDESSTNTSSSSIPRPTSSFLKLPLPSSQSRPLLLTRKALSVKSCPSSDTGLSTSEIGGVGKYIADLRQIRVHSAAEAKALLRLGQMHRRVFGTLANSQSSRSHALVTIKILRVHRGERNDPTSIQTSRLTLVDLAGSERTKHTQTSGDRLREAGSINKSLMVLGQCMETLRANQRSLARSLGTTAGRVDTRDVKKGLAIVPFRHSKLTEILMDYFTGEGRAVMIVNVNPYDTGFDENSHVMRFAALAREVCTVPATAVPRALPVRSVLARDSVIPHRRKVTISTEGPGRKASEAHLEVLEEDEEPDDEDDDEPINPLVDALFDEIEALRAQLFEAEMQCAVIEAETREEVMEEMEERMRSMEKMFKRRLMKEVEQNEKKMDAKIDMLNQTKARHATRYQVDASDEDEDLLSGQDDERDELEPDIKNLAASQRHASSQLSRSTSPLAGKGRRRTKHSSLRPDLDVVSDSHYSTSEEGMDVDDCVTSHEGSSDEGTEDDDIITSPSEDSDELEHMPSTKPSLPKDSKRSLQPSSHTLLSKAPLPIFEADVKAGKVAAATRRSTRNSRTSDKLAALEHSLNRLSLKDSRPARDSTAVIPDKKARQAAVAHDAPDVAYVPQAGETDTLKKKKRQLGKNRVVTDDEMAAIILGTSQDTGKQIRRSARH